jgi:hypothetical protein
VNSDLIGWQLEPLLNGRPLNEVIVFASHDYRRTLLLSCLHCQQIRQGSGIAIQPIEPNDHMGQRKRERVGIRRDHMACLLELVAILPIARVSKRAQKLMSMCLQDRRPGSNYLPAFAAQISWCTHPVKAALRRRQVWSGWKRSLAGRLFGAINIDE